MGLSLTRYEARINVVFPSVVISLGCNSGTPLYLNPHARVNTILSSFWKPIAPGAKTQRGIRLTFYRQL